MADNVAITAGTGTTIAADDIAGVLHQRVKISQGADGSATDVSSASPLNVTLANTGANATPIVVDLGANNDVTVTGTVTANLAASTNNIGDVDVLSLPAIPAGTNNIGDVDVLTVNGVAPAFGTGVRGATVQRVTLATDDVIGITANSSVNVAQMNGVATTMGNGVSGTGVQRVTMASDSTGILAGVTTVTTLTNQSQMGGQAIAMGTGVRSAGTQRVTIATDDLVPVSMATNTPLGNIAHDTADSGAPIKVGGRARTSDMAAIASDDRSDFITDVVGKQIVLPYANPENFVSGAITTAMTATTTTSLVAAPAAGLRNYLTTIIVSNAHATVGTDVIIQDGSGGTTLMTIPAAAVYGGAVITLPTPLRQPTTATAIFCANVTTGASTKVSAIGYIGR